MMSVASSNLAAEPSPTASPSTAEANSNAAEYRYAESALQLVLNESRDPTILTQADALADRLAVDSGDDGSEEASRHRGTPAENHRALLGHIRLLVLTFQHSGHYDAKKHTLIAAVVKRCRCETSDRTPQRTNPQTLAPQADLRRSSRKWTRWIQASVFSVPAQRGMV